MQAVLCAWRRQSPSCYREFSARWAPPASVGRRRGESGGAACTGAAQRQKAFAAPLKASLAFLQGAAGRARWLLLRVVCAGGRRACGA